MMSWLRRRWYLGLLALALLAVVLPFYSADYLKARMQSSLERSLRRSVILRGDSHVRLLPWPAYVAEDVTIGEDPQFSLEPFAYMSEIIVEPSWLALLQGELEAKKIRLNEPSVNLMRGSDAWNVQSLLASGGIWPEIEVRGGRLNFKQQNEKSAFYLANVLADIGAPSARGDIDIFVEAEPARTDRGAQGFGKVSLRGGLSGLLGKSPGLDFRIELQPSAIHAFNFFFGARSVDFAGTLSSRGRLSGPLDAAQLEGWTEFEGVAEKAFLPFGANSKRLEWRGLLDLKAQRFALDSVGNENLRVRLRARELFQAFRGAVLVDVRDVALEKLIDLARQANTKLPAGVSAQGRFSGVVGYSLGAAAPALAPVLGMIWFDGAELSLPENPLLAFGSANVLVNGTHWTLPSTAFRVGEQRNATIAADWNSASGALNANLATQQMGVNEVRSGVGLLLRNAQLPLLAAARGGVWQGNLRYERKEDSDPGVWSGRLLVSKTQLSLDGLSSPLELSNAIVSFDPNRVDIRKMQAQWQGDDFVGSLSYFPGTPRPTEFEFTFGQSGTGRLAAALSSAMEVPQGLLERIRFRRAIPPDWLRDRNLRGRLTIQDFEIPGGRFHPLQADVDWRGTRLELKNFRGSYAPTGEEGSAQVEGNLLFNLFEAKPRHRFEGKIKDWPAGDSSVEWQGRIFFLRLDDRVWPEAFAEGKLSTSSPAAQFKCEWRGGILSLDVESQKREISSPNLWPLKLDAPPELQKE